MKLINKKLNLSSDDVIACTDYEQLKYWMTCINEEVINMESDLMVKENPAKEMACKLQKMLSRLVQNQMAKIGKPRNFQDYFFDAVKEMYPDQVDEIMSRARELKNMDEL
jgi:hypothetical protein